VKKFFGVLLLFSLVFAWGCSKNGSSTNKEKRYVNVAIASCVRSLDPRIGNEYPSAFVIRMLYEGLMRMGEDGQLFPGMAESYEVSEDQIRYTFHLRSANWSNGDKVTAYDFEYAWKKAVDPSFAKTGAFTFYAIKNVEACLQGKVDVGQVGVKALDEKTLVVDLEHPAPYFLALTACPTFMPINKRIDLEKSDWANKAGDYFTCNGPFIMDEWRKGDFLTLKKNQRYWNVSDVLLAGIKVLVVEDAMTQFYLFEKGKIDWFGDPLLGTMPPDILKDPSVRERIQSREAFGLFWFFLNTEIYPLNNKSLRKALAYSINRSEIAEHVLQMGERPAMGILAEGFNIQTDPYFDDGNLKKAREYFNQALQELDIKKEEFPKLTISISTRVASSRLNQAIQQQWHDALGIDVELDSKEWPVHFTKLSKGDFQVGEVQWVSWLYDPIYLLETFRIKSFATNMSSWEHPEYRHLLDLADNEVDVERRKELLRRAETFLMEEMPVIPICFSRVCYMKNPKLHGVYISPLKELDFRWAYFED